ncbi:MAG: hypothetical protein NWE93_10655 [Candidatus Bathyarchaeota archaeon]|nr:hypothetical protein [Candidatus Bathyarchaeota archaeon]
MRKHSVLVAAVISILALFTSISVTQYPLLALGGTYHTQAEKAVNYLTNVMYVPSVGLLKAAPIAEPNTIWLTNDNLLAYAVLSGYNHSLSETLNQSLAEYGVSGNGLVELTLNKTIEPIRASNSYNISVGEYIIKEDIRDGDVMQDFTQYADLCFWWSQNLLLKNDIAGAITYFNQGMSMWNGTGFIDKPFNANPTEFQTYKIGLALWIAKSLNCTTNGTLTQQTIFTDANYAEMQTIIWNLQDPTDGGIHTGYTSTLGNISSNTDTNVETTSICLLYRLVARPPCIIPEFTVISLVIFLMVNASIAAVVLHKRKLVNSW